MSEGWVIPLVLIILAIIAILGINKVCNDEKAKAVAKYKIEIAYQSQNKDEIIKALEGYVKVLEAK